MKPTTEGVVAIHYFAKRRPAEPSALARDPAAAARLWGLTGVP